MYIARQFSIFMVNKPGVLAQVLGEFARAKINITAITMMDSVEHGVMRVIFASPQKAKEVLIAAGIAAVENDYGYEGQHRSPGQKAGIAKMLLNDTDA